ncbi:MAG: phosphoribosylformylglycinamidine synthase [Methanocorpusculum sp.]|nr:phosphoribosylformylglycinamidine synthase [Methanocorpusculum sp.]
MVYRIFVEKKPELANEAKSLSNELKTLVGIEELSGVRLVNRYDVENIDKELFEYAKKTVFSEPQLDIISDEVAVASDETVFAVEYLPGQFDQRADSAAQCIQLISQKEKPLVKTARVYILKGKLSEEAVSAVKKYVINPVEAREASLDKPKTLFCKYSVPSKVETLNGFRNFSDEELTKFITQRGLAMDFDDIKFCRDYFKTENRDPTITEIKVIDTYWSDHCRHTTFFTTIDSVKTESPVLQKAFDDYLALRAELKRDKPVSLMDLGTIAVKYLKKEGLLKKLDESDEINACTVKIKVTVDGKDEDWLLLFKNETHNHPTEIEPFGGAATCVGGAIRDPLSGRAYVYAAMRLTGAGNPLAPVSETLEGKLPQRKIVSTAAAGYSSYGNQIGLATGQVDELYHEGYVAKRMEIGAVIGAVPADCVRREVPKAGDAVILLGGKTGRDGCGGAAGSSKAHTVSSIETCGAEVQKGNAPEERKIQRLFRNKEASLLIKRCNDFGAGGVSVAIGELADGLDINLNAVPKKYEGLDGTELAISESQERMAVVVEAEDVEKFIALADAENLEATKVADVTDKNRLVMNWNGDKIVDISREFLDTNGTEKHTAVEMEKPLPFGKKSVKNFTDGYKALVGDLNVCSKRGLSERFDSTIGAGTVLMPFGGKYQLTPSQAMVYKISVENKDTNDCSLMTWGYNPYVAEKSPYHAGYLAVVESVSKLVAAGASFEDVYLSFQEYFEKLGKDAKRWGKPASALLGAFKAQMGLKVGAIGGKDSMSGSFEKLDVPPTLVSFAVTTEKIENIISNDFKAAGHKVFLIKPEYDSENLPTADSLLKNFSLVTKECREGKVLSCQTSTYGGIAEAVFKMAIGNKLGFEYADGVSLEDIFGYSYGSFIIETDSVVDGILLGETVSEGIKFGSEKIPLDELLKIYENKLESVYPCNISQGGSAIDKISYAKRNEVKPKVRVAHPKVLIPVFPGTNCEYDSAKAVARAGAVPEIFIINNKSASKITESVEEFAKAVKRSQAIFIPGGFSGGDEPDGSGKFITAFFRNAKIKEAVSDLLDNRDGLMCGICNGFQAIIKLGLVPYGKIIDTDENSPTLTFNTIGRHQSKLVRVRVASVKSPWLSKVNVDDVFAVPISHGEGRFLASDEVIRELIANGQVLTQYVDLKNNPTSDVAFNPNNSVMAIEGITSPDGRVLGKMGHAERIGKGLYKNFDAEFEMKLFESLVEYYK